MIPPSIKNSGISKVSVAIPIMSNDLSAGVSKNTKLDVSGKVASARIISALVHRLKLIPTPITQANTRIMSAICLVRVSPSRCITRRVGSSPTK